MPREIKLRFWDKHNKVWVGPYTLKQLADEDQFSFDREYQPICSTWECYESSEYTGRKDDKGQEIYECDIVRFGLDGEKEDRIGAISYSFAEFTIVSLAQKFPDIRLSDAIRIEVIGDIYQHVEFPGKGKDHGQ